MRLIPSYGTKNQQTILLGGYAYRITIRHGEKVRVPTRTHFAVDTMIICAQARDIECFTRERQLQLTMDTSGWYTIPHVSRKTSVPSFPKVVRRLW